ncbi:MAG: cytochrome c [Sphingomonadales bacterium]|nr:cytochrome c [Sphingomonadales bacterium]
MRNVFIASAAVALAAAGTAAFAGQKLGQVQPQRAPEYLYPRTCGYCHGHNVGPVILGRQLDAELVKAMVRTGRNGMPAFRPTEISNAELEILAKWVETSKADSREGGR